MRTRQQFPRAVIFLIPLFLLAAVSVEAAYVRSARSFLRAAPDNQANKVLTLKKGEEVNIIDEKGLWRQVRVRGKTGWISKLRLSETDRFTKIGNSSRGNTITRKKSSSGFRSRTAQAAIGVKGLRESQIEKIQESYNMEALKAMEALSVDEGRATEFILDYQE